MHTMPKDIYLLIWTKLEAVGPFSFGMNIWLNILFVELFDSISNASWSVRLNLPACFFWCVHAVLLYLIAESCDLTSVCVWLTLFRHDTHLYTRTHQNKKKCCCSIMFVYASMLVQKPILYAFIYIHSSVLYIVWLCIVIACLYRALILWSSATAFSIYFFHLFLN